MGYLDRRRSRHRCVTLFRNLWLSRRPLVAVALCAGIIATPVTISAAVTNRAQSEPQPLINVTFAEATHASDFMGYDIAIARGYYKKEGFNVTSVRLTGAQAVPAEIAGSIQFAAAGGSAIPAAMRGEPVKVMSVAVSSPVYVIIAEKSIKNLKGLIGKELGVQSKGDTTQIADNIFLPKNGIMPSSLTEVALGYVSAELSALEAGAVPAITGDVQQLGQLQTAGLISKFHVIGTELGHVTLPITGLAVSTAYLSAHPLLVQKFLYATAEGVKYGLTHEKYTVNLLSTLANETPTAASYDYRYSGQWPVDGTVSFAAQRQAIAAYGSAFGIPIVPPGQVFDFALARKVYKEVFGKKTGTVDLNHPPLICGCSKGIGK